MRRIILWIAAAALLMTALGAAACSKVYVDPPIEQIGGEETPQTEISGAEEGTGNMVFKNGLAVKLSEVCVSASSTGEWGSPVLTDIVGGDSAEFEFNAISTGTVLDIGTISEDGVNYDAFGVRLSDGDSIILTGDWESGVFTVLHANGSKDFYTAKVYWSLPEESAAPITVSVHSTQETLTDGEGLAIGTFNYQLIKLDPESENTWPELSAAVAQLNSSRIEAAAVLALSQHAPENGEDGEGERAPAVSITETATVCRSDSAIVSILFETRTGSEEQSSFIGVNIDPKTGVLLTPADIVTDVQKLPHLMNLELAAMESVLEINEYRDHVADFSRQSKDYAFVMEGACCTFVFNVNAFNSGIAETVRICLDGGDDPFLIKPLYLAVG